MASTLPPSALVCHATAQAVAAFGAAWVQVGLTDPASTVPLIRTSGSAAAFTAAIMRGNVAVQLANEGSEPVFVTCVDPGVGASSLGHKVPAGRTFDLPVFGTGAPPRFWVYGHASNPEVIITALLGEVV